MPAWLSFIIDLWPIASTITPILLAAGFLWLRTKFPLKADFEKLEAKVEQLADSQIAASERLKAVEKDLISEPTRVQLLGQMNTLSRTVSRVEAQTEGVMAQLKTVNEYLQLIIERGLGK